MLLNINVENLISIDKEQTLSSIADFHYSGKESSNCFNFDKNVRIRKATMILGANGSGKSNILKSLGLIHAFVAKLYNLVNVRDILSYTGINTFFNNNKLMSITVDFSINCRIFKNDNESNRFFSYSIKFDKDNIHYESFKEFKYLDIKSDEREEKIIFQRQLKNNQQLSGDAETEQTDSEKKSLEYDYIIPEYAYEYFVNQDIMYDTNNKKSAQGLELFKSNKAHIEYNSYSSRSIFTSFEMLNNTKINDIITYFSRFTFGRNSSYSLHKDIDIGLNDLNFALERYNKMNQQQKNNLQHNLHSIGALFDDIEVNDNGMTRTYLTKYNSYNTKLNYLSAESDGTRKFFDYFAIIDYIIENDGILIIDEIENHLHPILIKKIIEYLYENGSQAQIIFTTHNPLLLNTLLLDNDQIWFTKRNKNFATELYSLSDFDNIDNSHLLEQYLAGTFDGIPEINFFRK